MKCPRCGLENDDNHYRCTSCSTILHPPAPPPPQPAPSTMGGLIPHNQNAVIAYYLGIFSFIPFLGILLGIPAFILGIKGDRYARANPTAKGRIHAWVGIIAGGLFGFGYLLLLVAMIAA